MYKLLVLIMLFMCVTYTQAQMRWKTVDSLQANLPKGLKIYFSNDSIEGKPNISYYVEADLKNKHLLFDVDTTFNRRLTPNEFYAKNEKPYIVVNGTFFNFKTNQNLNTVIKNGKAVSYNIASTRGAGKDSNRIVKMYRSAIGISKKRKADVAWIQTDSIENIGASQMAIKPLMSDSSLMLAKDKSWIDKNFAKWNMQTAIGGGPVLVQNGEISIFNNEELLFTGKGRFERNPRTAMGYTANGKLIILVIEGRNAGKADGADLVQEATILKDLGCIEALNLDGGGSSCMLVNGIETIKPSDKTGQRSVPAVFIIRKK
jgi:exopolysaccharide biosynthesis protein